MPETTETINTSVVTVAGIAPIPAAPQGAYATYEDFVLRFQTLEVTQLSQPKISNPIAPDRERVESALLDASGMVDSYLRARYESSIAILHASPPVEIVRHTCNIARYFLAQNRPTDSQREMYEDAIKWCEFMLKEGRSLLTRNGTTVSQDSGDVVNEDGSVTRDETYSRNYPLYTSTARQVHSRQRRRSFGGGGYSSRGRRW